MIYYYEVMKMRLEGNVIAHRGIHNNQDIPENSLLAFQKALQKQIPIELDVQLTKDCVLVVFHDYSLFRMTGKKAYLQDLTYRELQELNLLETNEKIPRLRDVLQLINNQVLLDIEVKNTHRFSDVCSELQKELSSYHHFVLKSFHPMLVKRLKKEFPNIEIGFLINDHYSNFLYDKFMTSKSILRYLKPDFIAVSKKLLKKKSIKSLTKEYQTMVWTIDSKDEMAEDDFIYICNHL